MLFLKAEVALLVGGVEALATGYNFPRYFMGDLRVFQPPHMVTEGCALSFLMVELLVVLVQPPFEGADNHKSSLKQT